MFEQILQLVKEHIGANPQIAGSHQDAAGWKSARQKSCVYGHDKPYTFCENGLAAMSAEDRDRDFVLLARLVRTQGRHGELIADILTDFPDRFSERVNVWLLPPDAKAAPREVL